MADRAFVVGERVFYVLPVGYGRPKPLYLPATITNITARRIVILLDGHKRARNTLAASLCRVNPAEETA